MTHDRSPHSAPRARRSLSHVGGEISISGDTDTAEPLARALDVTADEAEHREHVHAFHTYPARLHPITARRLVEGFSNEGARILDPFCGSGTVLVEGMLAQRKPVGTDLNPLAVELSRSKTRSREPAELEAFVESAKRAAAFADERRRAKAGATERFGPEDVRLFAPHVLLELGSLRASILKEPRRLVRMDLLLVLSSMLVKFSQKRGDTSEGEAPKRIGAGFPARFFVRKAEEYARALSVVRNAVHDPRAHADLFLDDATKLTSVHPNSIETIITSPPYAATYDYVAHHRLRLRWVGLSADEFADQEIGARRNYRTLRPAEARTRWVGELRAFFEAARRVLVPGGQVVIVMADSAVQDEALRADELVASAARHLFDVRAAAAQARPHFHAETSAAFARGARRELAIALERR